MALARPETTGRKPSASRQDDPTSKLVYSVQEAGRLLGLSRNAAYAAAKRGDFQTLRFGRHLVVPKIPLHRMLGITATAPAVSGNASDLAAEDEGAGEKDEEA